MSFYECAGCGCPDIHVDDEFDVPGHGLCWPCASAKLDDVLLDARAQRIRDIVAQQWAVAIVVIRDVAGVYDDEDIAEKLPDGRPFVGWRLDGASFAVNRFAALPSAAEIVGGEP